MKQEATGLAPWCVTRLPFRVQALSAWGLFALLALIVLWRYSPSSPLPADAEPERFSATRALERMDTIVPDDQPRPTGSAANLAAVDRLEANLRELGLEPERQQGFMRRHWNTAWVQNVVARIEGSANSDEAILVMAHHDSVAAGPGWSDDTGGVAILLELARIAQHRGPWERDVILLITDGEEIGLLGARLFALEHRWHKDVRYVLNLEARGTTGPSILFEFLDDPTPTLEGFANSPRPVTSSVAQPLYKQMPNDSDLTVFRRDSTAFGANLAYIGGLHRYHTPLDDRAHRTPGSLQHQGDSALAILDTVSRMETALELATEPPEPLVFFDVLALTVIVYPASWSPTLAWSALLLLLGALGFALFRKRISLKHLGVALLAAPITTALAVASASGVAWLLVSTGGLPPVMPLPAYIFPVLLAEVAAGALVIALITTAVRRWTSPVAWWSATAMTFAALSVYVSGLFPEAAYILTFPALASAIAAAIVLPTPLYETRGGTLALLLTSVAITSIMMLGVASLIIDGFGLAILTPGAWLVVLTLTTLGPVLGAHPDSQKIPIMASGGALLVGLLLSWMLPLESVDNPSRSNIVLRQIHTEDGVQSHWVVMNLQEPVPEAVLARAEARSETFGARERLMPWSHALREGPVAEAKGIPALPTPNWEVQEEHRAGSHRTLSARLSTARGAPQLGLHFNDRERITGVRVEDQRCPFLTNGWGGCKVFAVPPEGYVDVTITIKGDAPVDFWLYDKSYGLDGTPGTELLDALPDTVQPA